MRFFLSSKNEVQTFRKRTKWLWVKPKLSVLTETVKWLTIEILKSQFFRHPMQPSHTAAVHPAAVENFRSCGSSKIEGSQVFHTTTTKLTPPKLGEPGEVNP